MATAEHYLAFDLGAESGRAILGTLEQGRLSLSEIHRFANDPVRLADGLHWDVLRLWKEIKSGILGGIHRAGGPLSSLGLDSWGVDIALLDRQGSLLGNPFHYRDSRTDGMLDEAFRRAPRERIFEATGTQFMQINSLYQLLSMVVAGSPQLDAAHTVLTIGDLFNYWLTGQIGCEFTLATTTQCFSPRTSGWATDLLEAFHIPVCLFPDLVQPGTLLGPLHPCLVEELGKGERQAGLRVVTPACHDTASAVAAVPAGTADFAWISSGTWSILGTETRQPVITPRTLEYNFTNEGGVCGPDPGSRTGGSAISSGIVPSWLLCKNTMALWLVQECRRAWAREAEALSYGELTRLAAQADPFLAIVDPDWQGFLKPGDMPARVQTFCRDTGQRIPQAKGEIVRSILESIAVNYRLELERLDDLAGRRLDPVHIIGGGSQNRLLNQFTADATGRVCITGPVEATTIGNLLVQGVAMGHLDSLQEARKVVQASFPPEVFEPHPSERWEAACERMGTLKGTA